MYEVYLALEITLRTHYFSVIYGQYVHSKTCLHMFRRRLCYHIYYKHTYNMLINRKTKHTKCSDITKWPKPCSNWKQYEG